MRSRILRTAAATLSHTFMVDETPTDSSTTVTVAITDANGAAVQSGNATSAGAGTGRYTFALTPQAALARLTVAWSATIATAAVVEQDQVEVVGARFFSLADGRASDPALVSTTKYPTAALAAALLEVEQECEEICDRGFVPHYGREVLDGSGTPELALSGKEIRTIRAVRVAPRVGQSFVALTTTQLASLTVTADGLLVRSDRDQWLDGRDNVIVEYEYGLDSPPPDLLRANYTRFRSRLNLTKTAIPDRVTSYTTPDGDTYRIDQPGPWKTGIPDVDALYARYSLRSGAGGQNGRPIPASRPLNYDPQRFSMFHGPVR